MKQDGYSILADFEGEETQVAIIAPPTRSHPDHGYNARVRAWAAEYMRLFLAAPDLLAACELLAKADDAMQRSDDDPSDVEAYEILCEAIGAARAAIAKAKGASDD